MENEITFVTSDNITIIQRSSSMNDLRECLQDEGDFNFIIKVGNYEKVSLLLLAATSLGCSGLEDLCYTYLGFFFRCKYIV